jgi:hypothetical protein
VETRQVRNDYTIALDAELYQIERQAVVSGLRKANVRVEKRLDGSLAVRLGERYLPVSRCTAAAKTKAPVKPATPRRPPNRQRGSKWGKNFDFEKGAKDMASRVRAEADPEAAFSRHDGICRSDVFVTSCKPGPAYRLPPGSGPGHKARRKQTRLLIVATSSGRLFLDQVGRHQSPSPLHRHTHSNMHFSQAPAKGAFLLCQQGDTFLFCLDTAKSGLCNRDGFPL